MKEVVIGFLTKRGDAIGMSTSKQTSRVSSDECLISVQRSWQVSD